MLLLLLIWMMEMVLLLLLLLLLMEVFILVVVIWGCVVDHIIFAVHIRVLDFRVLIFKEFSG